MNIILFGAPGAGKGTQAKKLVSQFGFTQVSTGDLVRQEMASGSELGQKIQACVNQGQFPEDDVIIALLKTYLLSDQHSNAHFIFDGYPRTENQACVLEDMFRDNDLSLDAVVVIDVDADTVKKRILGRFSCDKCGEIYNDHFKPTSQKDICDVCGSTSFTRRGDDTAEAIENRLTKYEEATKPVIEFYKGKHSIVHINGNADFTVVFSELTSALDLNETAMSCSQ